MVDIADISRVNSLMQRYGNYLQALSAIRDNGRIAAFVVVNGDGASGAQISTEGIDYPAQMIDAIRTQLEYRLTDIVRDLEGLGVQINGGYR